MKKSYKCDNSLGINREKTELNIEYRKEKNSDQKKSFQIVLHLSQIPQGPLLKNQYCPQ